MNTKTQLSVAGIPIDQSHIDYAARAVLRLLDGMPAPLDATVVEDAVYVVVQWRNEWSEVNHDATEVLKRVDQWMHLNLWDWE